MRILITGGAGFIGRHVTAKLRRLGHWVRWLDNLDPQIHTANAARQVIDHNSADEMLVADVRDKSAFESALESIEAVVHLAAQTGTGQSMYRVQHYVDVNVGGTGVLWDVLANDPGTTRLVVVASSRSVYGEGAYHCMQCGQITPGPRARAQLLAGQWELYCPVCGHSIQPVATPEDSKMRPASLYACTKLSQEHMSLTMGQALGISTCALRFQNVYGPGQSLRNPYTGIISIFSNQLRQNLPVNIYEDGQETRDFVFVEDVADICVRAIESADIGQQLAVALNVGRGQPVTVWNLAQSLKLLWNSKSVVTISGDYRVGDIRHNWADLSLLRQRWPDWQATPLDDGLRQFVAWARQQPVYTDLSSVAASELKNHSL